MGSAALGAIPLVGDFLSEGADTIAEIGVKLAEKACRDAKRAGYVWYFDGSDFEKMGSTIKETMDKLIG